MGCYLPIGGYPSIETEPQRRHSTLRARKSLVTSTTRRSAEPQKGHRGFGAPSSSATDEDAICAPEAKRVPEVVPCNLAVQPQGLGYGPRAPRSVAVVKAAAGAALELVPTLARADAAEYRVKMLQPTAAHRAPQFWRRRIRCRRGRAAGVHDSTPSTQPLGPPLSTGERAEHVQRRHVLRHDGSQYVTERRDVMACRRCPRGPRCERREPRRATCAVNCEHHHISHLWTCLSDLRNKTLALCRRPYAWSSPRQVAPFSGPTRYTPTVRGHRATHKHAATTTPPVFLTGHAS